jgi:hypothetical protein
MFGAALSAALGELGRLDEARAQFDALMGDELTGLSPDYTRLAILALASVACAHLEDAERADLLYQLLEPHSERFVNGGASWFGAVAHYLGLLAAVMGRAGEAHGHLESAERSYVALGAAPWLTRLGSDRGARLPLR